MDERAAVLGVGLKYSDECVVYHSSRGDINETRTKLIRAFRGRMKSRGFGSIGYIKLLCRW